MTERDDPLWNPQLPADPELARLQRLLAAYGSAARAQAMPPQVPPRSARRRGRRIAGWAMAAGFALLLVGAHHYRLAWSSGQHWSVTQLAEGERSRATLAPGQGVTTGDGETARIAVARIGNIALSPRSRLRLVETAAGRHSVALDHGHLRARIWAPPGYFRAGAGAAEVVDLGCDFELWQEEDGAGRVRVHSGWISYRHGADDILVAEGHVLAFAGDMAGTPMRHDAPAALVAAVRALEAALRDDAGNAVLVERAARRVADIARDADAFTLLSLLTRRPALARTALYARLAAAIDQPVDAHAHRAAWAAGDRQAMNLWWDTLPRQPKQWWGGWKDLL
ncbi:hypothetical protein H0E84_07440 [Luteimonas sp. SJ-92]|uniref:FecR protein domain-containing protein n=1 Tax=Luteimonas salinisoli TaxID=2752307 RepID=A0A853JC41_9GAMM|nr:hypothetical protein [Luteimonas salinisoli]NZA26217.1 hypothetical protein [Luteimonas salinisoli]